MTPHRPVAQHARTIRDAATELIDGGLGAAIRRLGPMVVSGSYYFDTMVWPDVDIYVELKNIHDFRTRFLSLASEFGDMCDLISLSFKDHVANPVEGLPEGLYWGVRFCYVFPTPWKLDLWAVTQDHIQRNQNELDRLKRKMTPELRDLILTTKASILTPAGRTPPLSSYPLYCAVLDLGLPTAEAIVRHLRKQGVLK